LQLCTSSLEVSTFLRNDPSMQKFSWFLYQYMPAFAYIHLLRLLQTQDTGQLVDQAWHGLEGFVRLGISLPLDSLVVRGWRARETAAGLVLKKPAFVEAIFDRLGKEDNTVKASDALLSHSDYTSILSEIMASDYTFDWPMCFKT
jgi:hypothetical protein